MTISKREQLEVTVASLAAQRAELGDEIVEVALIPLHEEQSQPNDPGRTHLEIGHRRDRANLASRDHLSQAFQISGQLGATLDLNQVQALNAEKTNRL